MGLYWASLDTNNVINVYKLDRHADVKEAEKSPNTDQVYGPFKAHSFSSANNVAKKAFNKQLKNFWAVRYLDDQIEVKRHYGKGSDNAIDRALENNKIARVMHKFKASDMPAAIEQANEFFNK